MKKLVFLLVFCSLLLVDCGGGNVVKPSSKPASPATTASKPVPSVKPSEPTISTPPSTTPAPSTAPATPAGEPGSASNTGAADTAIGDNSKKPGGYYLDDGPDANPPANIDEIPNASPKNEALLPMANRPYKALGATYTPLTSRQNYKARGMASWYGKRFHGKKTSSGEIYNMYAMTAAHTTLPLPSYAKVTNPANGRFVIVRVNDRGPFKSSRIIDLSYAAAYKLRIVNKGSGLVDVETIHPDQYAQYQSEPEVNAAPVAAANNEGQAIDTQTASAPSTVKTTEIGFMGYFVQVGTFKSEANANALTEKILAAEIDKNGVSKQVYNDGMYRLKLGPYETKNEAENIVAKIRKQLNMGSVVTTQP